MFPPDQVSSWDNSDLQRPLLAAAEPQGISLKMQQERRYNKPALAGRIERRRTAAPASVRKWLRIDQDGGTRMIQADKYRLASQLGVQPRDLRILDPALASTYPSAILCREHAVIVNLEHIKVVITTSYVLVVNPEDENVLHFVTELKHKLAQPTAEADSTADWEGGGSEGAATTSAAAAPDEQYDGSVDSLATLQLPFELKVLEVCLDSVAPYLNRLASDLEAAAYPALDDLTRTVDKDNLERVRRIKGRLVRLTKRVETIRKVLEDYLNDDEDMADLHLSAKAAAHAGADMGHAGAIPRTHGGGRSLSPPRSSRGRSPTRRLKVRGRSSSNRSRSRSRSSGSRHSPEREKSADRGRSPDRRSSSERSSSGSSSVAEEAIEQVEMLLEAYFMHLDNTYNRLQTLNEYIEDTEDLVNLKLDQHRNQLIGLDLLLTAFAVALSVMAVVAGFFGMNFVWSRFSEGHLMVVITSTALGALAMLAMFVGFLWRRKLLTW